MNKDESFVNINGDDNLSQEDIDFRSEFISNPNKNEIITDMDEILVNIAPKWVYELSKDREFFDKFLNFPFDEFKGEDELNKVLYRPTFYLNEWLLKDVEEMSRDGVTAEMYEEFMERFFASYDTKDFYDNLSPTRVGIGMREALKARILDKLHIVTRVTGDNRDSKINFIQDLFEGQMSKVKIYLVEADENKSDAVANIDNLDKIASLWDDENKNVIDILENTKLRQVEVMSPKFLYNQPTDDLIRAVENSDSTFTRYPYIPNNLQ